MSHTGLSVFDKTIQESNTWLKSLMEYLGTKDREYAYKVIKATLHALRDRIGPETAVHLAAQLPMFEVCISKAGIQLARRPMNGTWKIS